MTGDELRAAAERICGAAPRSVDEFFHLEEDAAAVGRAYLAEHPADSDQPVTMLWLISAGWQSDGVHLVLRGWGPDRNGTIQVYSPDEWFLNGTRICPPATRGDVRRLAKALGVELTEARP